MVHQDWNKKHPNLQDEDRGVEFHVNNVNRLAATYALAATHARSAVMAEIAVTVANGDRTTVVTSRSVRLEAGEL